MFAWQVLCPQSSPHSREFQGIYKWQKFITPGSGSCSVHNQWTSTFCSWLRSVSLRRCPHHSSGSFPSDSCVKNWIHSCGWSLYDSVTFSKTQTPSSSLFLFILWQLHLMYFDCFLPSPTLPRYTSLFPTYPIVGPLLLLKPIKYNLSIYSRMFGPQWGMDNLAWTLTELYSSFTSF